MQNARETIDFRLDQHLQTHPFWKMLAEEDPCGFDAVRSAVLAPGGRIRPLLFCAACRAGGREPDPDLMPAAVALELAHCFILVHDDLIDRSRVRRGEASLPERMHQQFTSSPAAGFRGADYALVAGDLLLMLAVEGLLQVRAPAETRAQAVSIFLRAALDTGRGALLEMRAAQKLADKLTRQDIEKIYALKTGVYTFELPLRLASLFCGEEIVDPSSISQVGFHAGIAFQLKNDLKSLLTWVDGGPLPDDVRDQRRTWALVEAGSVDRLCQPETLASLKKAIDDHARCAADLLPCPELNHLLLHALLPEHTTGTHWHGGHHEFI